MAGSTRRFTFAAIALPFLFVLMSGLARANNIFVNTTSGESESAPLCSLPDAIEAHNLETMVNGCRAGNGLDEISFEVTGTISIDETLEITNGILGIQGPLFGCSGAGPCGITIDGEGSVQILKADTGTVVGLFDLTLADGRATTASPGTTGGRGTGGAIFADGTELEIIDCLLRNNQAVGSSPSVGGWGGAIFGDAGDITIVNSTLADNTASSGYDSEGGAIWAISTMEITASTITGNRADAGGGYFNLPGPSLKGTIWSNNTNSNCDSTAPTDLGYNISDDGSCGFSGTNANNTDPLLEPLANNGGPTETFALETSPSMSPAIDRIPLAYCTDQSSPTPQPLGTDQRLYARPDPGNPNACDSGAYEVGALQPIVLNSERVQIARSSTAHSDQVNIGLTFTENGDPDCDLGVGGDEDALNDGINVALFQGTCAGLPANGLITNLDTFSVHTVNHQQYGTLFQVNGYETISARMVALPAPANGCSAYTLNLEVAGLNTNSATVNLPGGNPFALVLTDEEGDGAACFDVTNAITGNQIPTPSHSVRRGVRRQTRR